MTFTEEEFQRVKPNLDEFNLDELKKSSENTSSQNTRSLVDIMNDIDKVNATAKAKAAASANAVSSNAKTYTTAADRKNQIGNSVAQKATVDTPKQETEPLISYAQQAKNNIGNSIAKKVTTPASEKQEINYSVSPAQALKNQVANSALNVQKTAEKAAIDKQISERDKNFFPEQYEVFMTPAQQRKQQISDQIAENYNKGENWLMTDDGTDYFAKGFVNRLRSTGGKAVEDLAYFINDLAPSYKPATDVIEKNEAGQIGDIATQQMAQAQENADTWLGKQLVMAGDSTATMLGYMLLPGGKEHLAAYMGTGGGLDEYRQRREEGASELEAATRGITKGAISYLVESMGGIGAGVGQKIPGVSTIGKKLDEFATKNFFTSVLSNALDEGGEELVEYVADYVADCLADKMFKGEIQTDFDISEMLQNALTGAIVGGGFGVVKGATPQIDSAAKDIVEAVKNEKIQENAQAQQGTQTQQEAPAETAPEQAANIPAEVQTGQEATLASPTEKTFEQRAEELYKQGNSWGEIGKILQAEYHPDWKVDNVKKEARDYIRKSDFYGEKGTATEQNSPSTETVAEITNEAGAESPGFSNEQNQDSRPEGNTVGAKQSIEGTYANAQNKYDVFPEGENAARVVDVPQKMNDETNVTRFARTEMEAKVTPDSLIPAFEKAVEQGDFSYNKVTDKSAVDYAAKQIEKNGYEKSIGEFTSKVDGSKILTKNDLVIGEMLYAQAANAGDAKSAMELASALGHEFTKAGQAAQAARILKKLSPEGRLYNAQKIADRLYENGTSKSEIKIDEKLAQDLLNAKTDADIEAAEDAIKNNIAEQIEKTPGQKLADKWNAWRYLSMLGNPKTHIRNFLGNAAFYPVRKIKNAVKSVLETGTEEKTATLKRATKEQKDFAKESYDRNAKMLMSGGNYRFESDIESREQIFKSKILEALRKANGNALEAEDAVFLKNAYVDSLSQYLRANDIDPANITPEQQTKAENYAQKEAWKATYRDASKVASALEKFSKTNKVTKFAMDAFLPFRKTPINVLARGIEYSPVGLAKGIIDISAGVKKGKVDASTAIDELASGLTGTGITALGYWLASMGLLSGGDDENDKIQNFEELQGKQNYALDIGKIADYFGFNIGDVNYTIDWAAPTSLPLFVGVELYNARQTWEFDKDDAGRLFSATLDTISKTADPMIGLSMLQNLETVISGNYDGDAFSGLIGEAVVGYILQAFPTLGSQIAQTIDGTRRNAYFKDPNSKIPEELQIPLNRIMQKIPGLSQMLPERVDEWGRTEKQSDNIAVRAFENFISPGYIGRGNTTEVDKYLSQLYVKTGDSSILPASMAKNFTVDGETTNLSAKQYAEAQKVKGQTAYNLVEDVMNNSVFKGLSSEEQASVIADIYKYSTAIAKSKVSDYEPTEWIAKASEAEKQGLEVDDYITLHKIKSNLETTDEKSISEQFLEQLYVSKISDEAKVAALEYIGGVNVDKYRSAVDDPKDILALYDITSFKDAKDGQEEKDVDLEQIQKQFGTDIYDSREIYYKANGKWYNDYDEAIAGGDNRYKKAPVFERFNFSEEEVTKGYNAVIGLSSKDDMMDALTHAFGNSNKATTFYNILKGKKGYT